MGDKVCIFGHVDDIFLWNLSQPYNITKYGDLVYLYLDCRDTLVKLADGLGFGDAPFEAMVKSEEYCGTNPSPTPPRTCSVCMFPAPRRIRSLSWCEEHYRTAKQLHYDGAVDLLAAVQRFLWKLQLECEECKEDTTRCQTCAKCACEECNHWCPNCCDFFKHLLFCSDCGYKSCADCAEWCYHCDTCNTCCRKCRHCNECVSSGDCECGSESEADVAVEEWGLPAVFELHQAAATFYTLATMAERDPSYKQEFEDYARELAEVFAPYLDMAVGGEVRYGSETIGDGEARRLMPRIHKRYRREYSSISRGKAWAEWKTLRDEYGTDILKEAEYALEEGKWGRSVGGHAWAQVAATLRQFEEGG